MPVLYLIRGVPGSGKSRLARSMSHATRYFYEADQYFIDPVTKEYKFDPSRIALAHRWCQDMARRDLKGGIDCIVSNTSTTEREVETYAKIAEECNAYFVSIIVENRHGGVNTHGVPEDKVQQMKDRFSVKL
jgi:predicted ABC-type ATPase